MKKQSGFTLIELMIVVAVIGIVAMVAIPLIKAYSWRTYRLDECKNPLYEIAIDQAAYKGQTGDYTLSLADIARSEFSRENNPGDSKYTYTIAVGTTGDISSSFLLTCVPTDVNRDEDCGALTLDNFGREDALSTANGRTAEDCWR